MTEFLEVDEFSKDIKKLNKKYKTLFDDLETFKKALEAVLPNHSPKTVQIPGLGKDVKVPIFKVRRFRCKYLGGGSNSGIRVIYAYEQDEDRITLIEIYYKGDKDNEDRRRILKYYKT
jgi:mRNA-degrading endonuclease RelE of RelBE toxin-antitoxin system